MKVIISLTSVPSRFEHLQNVIDRLECQACHEIWLNIPHVYMRFPDWDRNIPVLTGTKLKINRDCEDLGPGTKIIGPANHLEPADIIVYLDDDTIYDSKMVLNLLKWWKTDTTSAWGLSGFDFENYFQKCYPRRHAVKVDVLEGYGAVLVTAGWIHKIVQEFKELRVEAALADDIIINNLLAKHGVNRKTCYVSECHIGLLGQLPYGFEADALHLQTPGGHHENYRLILERLSVKNKNYFAM